MDQNKKQKLGLWMLIALVAGNMIGSGIFMLPSEIAKIGSIGLLSWIFTSIGAIFLALVFAKMSLLVPKTGGPYAFAYAGFGEFIGFQTAYFYWIALWVGNAAIAVAMMGYVRAIFPSLLGHTNVETIIMIAVVWLLTLTNIIGTRTAGIVQIITTILKFIPFLIIILFGWFYFHPQYLNSTFNLSSKSNFTAFSYAATLTFWAFVGVESATVPASSVYKPARNIPLATMIGTAIAALIYILASAAIAGMIPAAELANSSSPFATATKVIFGKWGELIVAIGAAIACFGGLNGWILLQGQVPLAAAQDHLFPKIFAKCGKNNTPYAGQIISSLLITALLIFAANPNLVDEFQLITLLASTIALIAYLYTSIAEMIILPQNEKINFKNILNIAIAALATIYSFWAFFGSGKEILFYVTFLVFTSFPLYIWAHWHKRTYTLGRE